MADSAALHTILDSSTDHAADHLQRAIEHAAHFLPSQGPLEVFVHHNTLHAFEHLTFAEALPQASAVYGCRPYLEEEQYRRELARGRIRRDDLVAVLEDDLGESADELIGLLGTRFHLRLAMLEHPLRTGSSSDIRWVVAETNALRTIRNDVPEDRRRRVIESTKRWITRDFHEGRPATSSSNYPAPVSAAISQLFAEFGAVVELWSDATWETFALQVLWRICSSGVEHAPVSEPAPATPIRPRDALLTANSVDADELVHEPLIRFTAAFLDQGFAHWQLPERSAGMWQAFLTLYGEPGGVRPRWLAKLPAEIERLRSQSITPLESIEESLDELGVARERREEFIVATLVALRGWAGMAWQMETNAEWAPRPAPPGTLVEFLAVRLVLDRLAAGHVALEELDYRGPAAGILEAAAATTKPSNNHDLERAFLYFQLAQLLGLSPEELQRLPAKTWARWAAEIDAFNELERRRTFHLAYERRYRNQTLDALAIQARETRKQPAKPDSPAFQIICCLDEREESFRRHLEELAPNSETFSFAGFFAIAMYYRGAADAHSRPLCPVVVKPKHYVEEHPVYSAAESHRRRARTRRMLGTATHRVHHGSRSLVGGMITALFGPLASAPLVARILFPRTASRLRRLFSSIAAPPPTQLLLERTELEPGPGEGHIGYVVEEMIGIVDRVLRDTGLTSNFARLVIMCGHGSSSLNNPHESAHDCGACGGGRGGPNARAFAHMANDPRVRAGLEKRGLELPEEVRFVGAYHNTCDDSVTYYDLDRLPMSHMSDFEAARHSIDEARERNAHERCRRFESAPLALTPELALRHVEARAEDLAQVRPEYGHATNAVCFVGRRSTTRGLYLDRRTFLTSYDPLQDGEGHPILTRILQPVFPVCGGISLEYYFSYTDSTGYGCGTKLPHNITSLLGVMDGAASDLRSGLPWQMVEVHEPVRLLFVIETTPAAMLDIMDRNPPIAALVKNDWVQLATLDPRSSKIELYHRGRFEPYEPEAFDLPQVAASADWYRGWRDHLGYAQVKGA